MAPEGEISDEKKAAWEIFNEPGQILQEIWMVIKREIFSQAQHEQNII
jgi:hypothetical protein